MLFAVDGQRLLVGKVELARGTAEGDCPHIKPLGLRGFGVGNGNRTRNRWSHSPVLCQLSYSHRIPDLPIIAMTSGPR